MIEALLAMMALGIVLGGLLLIATVLNLRSRVGKLERLLQQQGIRQVDTIVRPRVDLGAAVPLPSAPKAPESVSTPAPAHVPPQAGPNPVDRLIKWVREDWLLKLGAFLLLVGLSWLVSYAFLNNWIGPMGRIAFGLVAGTAFIILGWWRIQKFVHQAGIFLVLGSTTILVTIYAAREIYDFFTPLSALIVMFLSTAFVALASVKYNSRALALTSIILAGIAPVLTNSPTHDNIALFSYLLVVTLGAIWIVFLTGRRELSIAALALVTAYSLPFLLDFDFADRDVLLLFAFAFAALFFVTNSSGLIRAREGRSLADLVTAVGNGLFLLSWIMTAAPEEWRSLLISAWMIVFVAGAFLIARVAGHKTPFYVYAGVGVIMLAAATSAELSGATLTIAYTVECAVIILLSYYLKRDPRISQRVSALLFVPAALTLKSMETYRWHDSVLNRDFTVLAIMAVTLAGTGLFLRSIDTSTDKGSTKYNSFVFVLGTIYAYILLWLSLHLAVDNADSAVTISLFVYTIVGLITYIHGRARARRGFVIYGGLLLAFVVGRLLTVDVWKMELTGRITTFLMVGALLMSTAFLVRKRQSDKSTREGNS